MKLITTNTVDQTQWDHFVERHPMGTIYHHSLWQGVIQKTYGYLPLYHMITENSGQPRAAISSVFVKSLLTGNRIISFPFSDICDPLVESSEELQALLKAVGRSRTQLNAGFAELRLGQVQELLGVPSKNFEYVNFSLSLNQKSEVIFESFHKGCIQRAVKKAQRAGITIFEGRSERDLKEFYRLHLITRKRHGVPIQPYRFFRGLWNTFLTKNMFTLLLASIEDRIVSGIILLWFKDTAYYKFGASLGSFLRSRANQLLMWRAIQLALDRGCNVFDFGVANSANPGLGQYKSRWGTHKRPLQYLCIPEGRKSSIVKQSSQSHHLLKVALKHFPAPLIHIAGELFYKHFA